jgi:hypothetical protein
MQNKNILWIIVGAISALAGSTLVLLTSKRNNNYVVQRFNANSIEDTLAYKEELQTREKVNDIPMLSDIKKSARVNNVTPFVQPDFAFKRKNIDPETKNLWEERLLAVREEAEKEILKIEKKGFFGRGKKLV